MINLTDSITEEMQACQQTCVDTQKICIDTLNYCTTKGGKYVDMTIMCMIRDCAEMCMMCINMIIDGSEFMGRTCELCAQMCDRCARTCEEISNDPKMMECAAACRKCAECCQTMGRKSAAYFRRTNLVTEETFVCKQTLS